MNPKKKTTALQDTFDFQGKEIVTRKINRPLVLWDPESPPAAVDTYMEFHGCEYEPSDFSSEYPYEGPASKRFRIITSRWEQHQELWLVEKGERYWVPRSDGILNSLTADLLAAAELLGGRPNTGSVGSMPGGMGASTDRMWIPLMGGGIGITLSVAEDLYTNEEIMYHDTIILGSMAYRALLAVLGFEWIDRLLLDEKRKPGRTEFVAEINELLAAARK